MAALVLRQDPEGMSKTSVIVLGLSMAVFAICFVLLWHVYRIRHAQQGRRIVPAWGNLL